MEENNKATKEETIEHSKINDLKVDKFAEINPKLSKERLQDLIEDIKENGQIHPVIVFEDHVIDGQNRLKAIKEINKTIYDNDKKLGLKVLKVKTSKEDAIKLAISNNDKRRHISKSQYAMIAAKKIVASRTNEKGDKKPKTEWMEIESVDEIKSNKVGSRMVKQAISILQSANSKELSNQIFNGTIDISEGLQKIYGNSGEKKTDQKDDTIVELTSKYSEEAASNYESYVKDKKKYTRNCLAKKVVELEEQLRLSGIPIE